MQGAVPRWQAKQLPQFSRMCRKTVYQLGTPQCIPHTWFTAVIGNVSLAVPSEFYIFQDMYKYCLNFLGPCCQQNGQTLWIHRSYYMGITYLIKSYCFIYAQIAKMCQHQDCIQLHETFSMSNFLCDDCICCDGLKILTCTCAQGRALCTSSL